MIKKYFTIRGFIDPLSLIGLGFLVITMIVGTAVVNNKGINLSPNKKAAVTGCIDNGGQCVSSTYKCSGGKDSTLPGCGSTAVCGFGTCTASTPNPTPKEISPCNTCSGSSCIKKSGSCDPGLNECDSGTDCESTTSNAETNTCSSTSRCKDNKYETCSSGNWTTKVNCTDTQQTCVNDSRKCIPSIPTTNTATCAKENEQITSTVTSCCEGLVKIPTQYGTYCDKTGTQCSGAQTQCKLSGDSYFETPCKDGYFQDASRKRCDLGCDGDVCKTTSISTTTKNCTARNCLGTSCQATTTTVNLNSSCPTSNCASDSNCVANTLTCEGKPIGTKICNNAGGYNYCSPDGKWYSQTCTTGTNCSNGECTTTNLITCAGSCLYGIPCSQTNRKTASGSCSAGSYCCGDIITENNCPYGDNYCPDSSHISLCRSDRAGYNDIKCSEGTSCQKKDVGGYGCITDSKPDIALLNWIDNTFSSNTQTPLVEGGTCQIDANCQNGFHCYNRSEVLGQLDLMSEGKKCYSLPASEALNQNIQAKQQGTTEVATTVGIPVATLAMGLLLGPEKAQTVASWLQVGFSTSCFIDPYSAACIGSIAAYQADPATTFQSFNQVGKSVDNLINTTAKSLKGNRLTEITAFETDTYTTTNITVPQTTEQMPPMSFQDITNKKIAQSLNDFLETKGYGSNQIRIDPYSGKIYTINPASSLNENQPIDKFITSITDSSTFNSISPGCLGTQCMKMGNVPVLQDIRMNPDPKFTGLGSQLINSFEQAAQSQGFDSTVITNIASQQALKYWQYKGYIIPASEVNKSLPYFMVKPLLP